MADPAYRGLTVRATGRGRSSSGGAVTDGLLVRTRRLDRFLAIDPEAGTVTVEAGMTLHTLHRRLGAWGLALRDPGEVAGRSVGGAVATGVRGAGGRSGGLCNQVIDLDVVCGDGTVVHASAAEEPVFFAAARAGIGAFGIVARVTLAVVGAFNLVERASLEAVDALAGGLKGDIARSDFFRATWYPHTRLVRVRRAQRTAAPPDGSGELAWVAGHLVRDRIVGARARLEGRRPGVVARSAPLGYLAAPAVATTTDRSYRVLSAPSWARYVEAEWAVPRATLGAALAAVVSWHDDAWGRRRRPALAFGVEVAGGGAEDAWLSPAFGRDTGYLAVRSAVGAGEEVADALAAVLAPFGARPGWGTLHPLGAAELAPLYPRWSDWQAVRRGFDPDGRFANPELHRLLG